MPAALVAVQPQSPASQPGGPSLSSVQRNVAALADALFDSPASIAPMPPAPVLVPAGAPAGQAAFPALAAEPEARKVTGVAAAVPTGAVPAPQQSEQEVAAAVAAAASIQTDDQEAQTVAGIEPTKPAAAQTAEEPHAAAAGDAAEEPTAAVGSAQQGEGVPELPPAAAQEQQQAEGEEEWADAEEAAGRGSQDEQQVFEDAAEHLEEPGAAVPPSSEEPAW